MLSFLCNVPLVPGKFWILRMSFGNFGQMLCLQRCGTGWPLPSPSRPEPKVAGQKRSPSSEASCMLCRPGSSWSGEVCQYSAFPISVMPSVPASLISHDPTHPETYLHSPSWLRLCSPGQILDLSSMVFFRMFRRTYTAVGPTYSTAVHNCLKVTPGFFGKEERVGVDIAIGTSRFCLCCDFLLPF